METIQQLKDKYSDLVNDIAFDQLELETKKPNLFEILGAVNAELRHSNILAYLIDPNESHNLDNAILKRILREVARDAKAPIQEYEVEQLDYVNVEIRREWNSIDILVVFSNTVVCIENKIWSKETGDQLTRYKKTIEEHFAEKERKVYVYLTPYGEISTHEKDDYVNISYSIIADSIQRILKIQEEDINEKIRLILKDYLTVIKRHIMVDDEMVNYARQLYKSHREIFDFVYDHKPDMAEELRKYFEIKVKSEGWVLGSKNKGYVRFLTPELANFIPSYSKKNGWPNSESFLFEIDYWWNGKNASPRILFKAVLSPGNNDLLKQKMREKIRAVEGAEKPWGEQWLAYFNTTQKYNWTIIEEDVANINTAIDKIWPKVQDIVFKIELALIEIKEDIIKLSNED